MKYIIISLIAVFVLGFFYVRATASGNQEYYSGEAAKVVEIKLTTYNLKKAGQAPVSITSESKGIKLEPGDQLIRIYKGKLIEVDVLDSGYKWKDEIYPTLTHISWKATGYQIGGNNFFGLPTKRRSEIDAAQHIRHDNDPRQTQ